MSSKEVSDSRTPKLPRLPREHIEAAKAGRVRLRLAAHAAGEHDSAPSNLCTDCPR